MDRTHWTLTTADEPNVTKARRCYKRLSAILPQQAQSSNGTHLKYYPADIQLFTSDQCLKKRKLLGVL